MAEITAALVKQLRDATNVSMMECKRALVSAEGDLEQATKILREMGVAVAAKKATRATNQGLVASASADDGKCASLVEVNCETDFVARNQDFIDFVAELARRACGTDESLADQVKDELTGKITEIGENLNVRRNIRYVLSGNGTVASYIHLGGKVGVLVEVGCEKAETAQAPVFAELARDLTLHVAACSPRCLVPDEVPEEEVASERAIFAKQVEGKPAQIIDKIVDGKMGKFYQEICLLNQGFVKEPKQSITDLLAEKGKELDDTLTIRRFVRYQLGA
jgi:elongation factor Ts